MAMIKRKKSQEKTSNDSLIDPESKKRGKKVVLIIIPIIVVCFSLITGIIVFVIQKQRLHANITMIQSASVGDYIVFGKYEQDNKLTNGKEDIEWLILEKETDSVLLISKYALDSGAFQKEGEKNRATWELCTLRRWLNGTFLKKAFNIADRTQIIDTIVTADKSPLDDSIIQGNNVTDKVFLLSFKEADHYSKLLDKEGCYSTEYARARGINRNASNDRCGWWLRTLQKSSFVHYVDSYVNTNMWETKTKESGGIRPAIWIRY